MAQNSIQKYNNPQELYDTARHTLDYFYTTHDKIEKLVNFLNSADAASYPDIETATLTALGQLRTQLNAYLTDPEVVATLSKVKEFIRI
jgi:hypothetical protein